MDAFFLTAKEMVPVRHTLTKMGWHQPPSPIQCDNSTAVGMENSSLVPPASLNLGICASIGTDADNPKSSSVTIGTRVLITVVITAQSITQLYNTRTRGLLDLRDVYIFSRDV